jgi:hypothetical protein
MTQLEFDLEPDEDREAAPEDPPFWDRAPEDLGFKPVEDDEE